MSQENVDTARRGVDEFNRAFTDASDDFFELLHDDVEWAPITTVLDGTTYRGRAAVRKWVEDLRRDWETYELLWDEVRDLDDDRVLALGSWHSVGRRSGVELHLQQAAWLVHVRNGKISGVQTFSDRNDAFEAAGLRD